MRRRVPVLRELTDIYLKGLPRRGWWDHSSQPLLHKVYTGFKYPDLINMELCPESSSLHRPRLRIGMNLGRQEWSSSRWLWVNMEHNLEGSVATRLSLLSPPLCPALPHEGQCFWPAAAPGSPPDIWRSSCHHKWEVSIALPQLPFPGLPLQLNTPASQVHYKFWLAHAPQCFRNACWWLFSDLSFPSSVYLFPWLLWQLHKLSLL